MGLVDSHIRQAMTAMEQGRPEAARAVLLRALAREPRLPTIHQLLATACVAMGLHDAAEFHLRGAIALDPSFADFHAMLGATLSNVGRFEEAEAAITEAVRLAPSNADALVVLGQIRRQRGRFAEAEDALRRATEIAPGHSGAHAAVASLLIEVGRPEDALAAARAGVEADPSHAEAAMMLAVALNYAAGVGAEEVFEAHARAGAVIEALAGDVPRPPLVDPDPARRIRVGLLSPDLREHAVARFLEPLLTARDRSAWHVTCYHTSPVVDATTARLRQASDRWRAGADAPDSRLAAWIREDRIDVLIDLSGYMAQHRIGLMARRPAPVQGTYLGYPHSTGLRRIDFRLVDDLTDPPGADALATERLVRLSGGFLCFGGIREPGPVTRDPGAGPTVFGSFNTLGKVSAQTLRLWAGVLAASPGARLRLKAAGLSDARARALFSERAARAGIDPERLDLLPATRGYGAHLSAYADIDVALDTFPYHGTTTTCEALLMGVPVVTLAGDRHASRVGVSLLTGAGMPENAAASEREYIAIAARLAQAPPAREAVRRAFLASPVCDAGRLARAFETAVRGEWARACEESSRDDRKRKPPRDEPGGGRDLRTQIERADNSAAATAGHEPAEAEEGQGGGGRDDRDRRRAGGEELRVRHRGGDERGPAGRGRAGVHVDAGVGRREAEVAFGAAGDDRVDGDGAAEGPGNEVHPEELNRGAAAVVGVQGEAGDEQVAQLAPLDPVGRAQGVGGGGVGGVELAAAGDVEDAALAVGGGAVGGGVGDVVNDGGGVQAVGRVGREELDLAEVGGAEARDRAAGAGVLAHEADLDGRARGDAHRAGPGGAAVGRNLEEVAGRAGELSVGARGKTSNGNESQNSRLHMDPHVQVNKPSTVPQRIARMTLSLSGQGEHATRTGECQQSVRNLLEMRRIGAGRSVRTFQNPSAGSVRGKKTAPPEDRGG